MTLDDLVNELPTDRNIDAYLKLLHQETDDRGCAIMGASFVEHCLVTCIRCRIADPGKTIAESWFKGSNAPFRTFSAKIQFGRALAVYGPVMHDQLSAIKDIRNVFAHRALPLDFKHPSILEACKRVAPFVGANETHDMKLIYATGCVSIGDALIKDAFKYRGREIEASYP